VIDNLTTGHEAALPKGCRFVKGDIRDRRALREAIDAKTDAVLHFAAMSIVGDSVKHPLVYFENNVGGTIELLDAMQRVDVRRIVFSSSAAVYGEPESLPIEEDAPCKPENPYGHSKLFVEKILDNCRTAWDLHYVSLRYFNAGGSTKVHGEHHDPESHLIPIVLDVALGRRGKFTVFGDDYDTRDGTCLRDYIHVVDLADAHVRALDAMKEGFTGVLNLGSESAFTVLEVVTAVEKITGKAVAHEIGPRRPGDPAGLLASSRRAEEILGWRKVSSSLEDIVRSAWEWRQQHPDGYPN
jgi:UDP-glucose 4-epimerase